MIFSVQHFCVWTIVTDGVSLFYKFEWQIFLEQHMKITLK
jgi:hypothetical protein